MSLCVMAFKKDGSLYIGADSRESANINGKLVVRNDHFEKIRKIHNKVIFASGNSSLVKLICDFYENQSNDSLDAIKEIAIKLNNYFVEKAGDSVIKEKYIIDGVLFTCCLTIALIENKKPVIYYLSSNDNFILHKYSCMDGEENKVIITGATNYVDVNEIQKTFKCKPIKDAYLDSYSKYAFEGIGGKLTVFKLDKVGITKFFCERIKDCKPLIYEKDNVFGHAVFAGKLQAADGTFNGTVEAGVIESSIINGSIINGSEINGGTINVDTDVTVGNNLRIGSPTDSDNKKTLYFNNSVNFSTYSAYIPGQYNLSLSCNRFELYGVSALDGDWPFSNANVSGLESSGYIKGSGVSGSFESADGKVITISNGQITNIV